MEYRKLGATGLEVSRLGIGLAEIGETPTAADQAGRVLHAALDNGINFLDSAACYGNSEELIGETVSGRRSEFILATKAGHVTGGYRGEAWTRQTILDSIERSLSRMKTDHIDIVQLHSCSVDVLRRGDVVEALQDARSAGWTRFIGYSGDNEDATWAVESGVFDTLQTSFNVVDQRARVSLLAAAKARNMGVIVKRPIANGVWATDPRPDAYSRQYFERAKEMLAVGPIEAAPVSPVELTLQFVMAHAEVDTAIVGTRNPDHLRHNIEMLGQAPPLSRPVIDELYRRFDVLDREWVQLR